MATYRIGTPAAAAPRARRAPRRRSWPAIAAVAAGILAISGATASAYRRSPARVGERFLAACARGDLPSVERLLDRTYQEAFAGDGGRLLATLHAGLPRRFHVEASGYPEVPGGMPERSRYHLRVAFEAAGAERPEQPAFILALAKQPDGAWRVAFLPTYHSLFVALHGEQGERFLRSAIAAHARGREALLEQWESASADPPPVRDRGTAALPIAKKA
jgi:hypothetical protein